MTSDFFFAQSLIFDFLDLFETTTFLENYPTKSEVLGPIGRTGCGSFACLSGYAQFFFSQKLMTLGKVECSIFFTFFDTLRLFSKTTLPNLRFWVQWVERAVGVSPA